MSLIKPYFQEHVTLLTLHVQLKGIIRKLLPSEIMNNEQESQPSPKKIKGHCASCGRAKNNYTSPLLICLLTVVLNYESSIQLYANTLWPRNPLHHKAYKICLKMLYLNTSMKFSKILTTY
ncbi:hypothetical protein NPIL_590131 [Nephila pilipes]|uniref:Uncharacterized protein n=1 Tax=Nephila pilipes TaxID=299642 RepID=A0A8X6TN47_NEPPI|nr:hypothetical protein NPIL_590131 [Nephila pilipes]